ncbi:MAG: hypothetical protein RLZZ153_2303 [Pseudomonadota bacterium]|jgi:hypothetical protein
MNAYDVCNGDADGLFALIQWRLAHPGTAQLFTGLKHDIALLERVHARSGDEVNVFDLAMSRNQTGLRRLLDAGARVRYVDHHHAGTIPQHVNLQAFIDTSAEVCTSVLVDRLLQGRHRAWAIAAAFGDNLAATAEQLAAQCGYSPDQRMRLRQLGEAVNYNAYGDHVDDVLMHPADLYRVLITHPDPLQMDADQALIADMQARLRSDMSKAQAVAATYESTRVSVFQLGDGAWTRRVIGPWANRLAQRDPVRAHAVARLRADGLITVSIRAPLVQRSGADRLARQFGGEGRAASAAIEGLAPSEWMRFIAALEATDWGAQRLS